MCMRKSTKDMRNLFRRSAGVMLQHSALGSVRLAESFKIFRARIFPRKTFSSRLRKIISCDFHVCILLRGCFSEPNKKDLVTTSPCPIAPKERFIIPKVPIISIPNKVMSTTYASLIVDRLPSTTPTRGPSYCNVRMQCSATKFSGINHTTLNNMTHFACKSVTSISRWTASTTSSWDTGDSPFCLPQRWTLQFPASFKTRRGAA